MINRRRGLFLVAVVAFLIALVVTFPARVAYSLADARFVAMSGIKGTIWSGTAREFSTNGVYLRDLTWRVQPLQLFTGKAAYKISGSPVSGFLESDIALTMGGSVTLTNLTASLPLQMLERAAQIPGLRGTASLRFERLRLEQGRAVAMDGTADVADLVMPMIGNSSLGGYRAEFFTQNNGVTASIEDTNGVVDLAGSLQIQPDGAYTFLGQVVAKPSTPDSLRQQLRYLGPANERGQQEIRLEGVY